LEEIGVTDYVKILVKPSFVALLFLLGACAPNVQIGHKTFYVDPHDVPNVIVLDHYGATGRTIQYFVNKDSLKILIDYDFAESDRQYVVKQKNDESASELFAQFIRTLRIDTLKNTYIRPGGCGLTRCMFVQKNSEEYKSIMLVRYNHQTIETLFAKIEGLIKDKKFKELR